MLRVLLAKDLRRAWRNPLPWLVNLALPLCITGLIGLAFGRHDNNQLGRIRFAVVDEDKTTLTGMLRGAAGHEQAAKYLDPVFLERAAAVRQINDNQISAVVIIPEHFTRNYLTGREPVTLELIKNPAESIHPAVLEEWLGGLVTGMNTVARNFQSELPDWEPIFEGLGDYHRIVAFLERAGDKLDLMHKYIREPLVGYKKETRPTDSKGPAGSTFNLFAYLLIGMAGMFLLFLAGTGMNDLMRELRLRTLERYRTFRHQLIPFVLSKVIFTIVLLLFGSAVILAGGGLVFRIEWQQPLLLSALAFCYACFAAGLLALVMALVPDERQANSFGYIVSMTMAIPGGCMFPVQNFPAFFRNHLCPLLPTYWFTDAARGLVFGTTGFEWLSASLKLLVLSGGLIALAAWLMGRRFESGTRA